jgi:predicted outer membrane protein
MKRKEQVRAFAQRVDGERTRSSEELKALAASKSLPQLRSHLEEPRNLRTTLEAGQTNLR